MTDQALSKKFPPPISGIRWPIPIEGKDRLYLDGVGSVRSRRASPRERFVDYLNWKFYGDNRDGRDRAENIAKYLDITPLAVPNAAFEAGRSIDEGDYRNAIVPGIAAVAPFLGKPAKLISNSIKRRLPTDKLHNLDNPGSLRTPEHGLSNRLDQPLENVVTSAPSREALPRTQNPDRLDDIVFTEPKEGEFWTRSTPWIAARRPFAKPPRNFADDYPNGAGADEAENLLHDIDNRPLTAKFVAGRRKVGGKDERVTPDQIRLILEGLGTSVKEVPRSRLGGGIGRAWLYGRYGIPEGVDIWEKLPKDQAGVVLGHEFGHVLDTIVDGIPTKGLNEELNRLYSELATGQKRRRNLHLPQHDGYEGYGISREKIAESIRTYSDNPNTIKTMAPKTAAAIRKLNDHPIISKWIQFNAVPLGSLAGAGSAATMSQSSESQAKSWPRNSHPREPGSGAIKTDGARRIASALQAIGIKPLSPIPDVALPIIHALKTRRTAPSHASRR